MANSFVIPKRAFDCFLDLIDLGAEKLARLSEEVEERQLSLDASDLAEKLAKAIDCSSEKLERAIEMVLIPMSSVRSTLGDSIGDFLKRLDRLIAKQNREWHEKHGEEWKALSPSLEPLLAPNSYFAQMGKAFQLVVARPTIARNIRIVTELRPLFDEEISDTKALLLTSTLVLEYDEADESKSLHLTVDQSDLASLQEQLDRAESKIRLLEEQSAQLGISLLIVGSDGSNSNA
jgi:hypothetical protein